MGRMARADFSLSPHERATYGATVTAKSPSGDLLTVARTYMTALNALREIAGLLDALDDGYRVVSISTPNAIERDMFANRVLLDGPSIGSMSTPERQMLGRIGRLDLLHPSLDFMTDTNGDPSPAKHRER